MIINHSKCIKSVSPVHKLKLQRQMPTTNKIYSVPILRTFSMPHKGSMMVHFSSNKKNNICHILTTNLKKFVLVDLKTYMRVQKERAPLIKFLVIIHRLLITIQIYRISNNLKLSYQSKHPRANSKFSRHLHRVLKLKSEIIQHSKVHCLR